MKLIYFCLFFSLVSYSCTENKKRDDYSNDKSDIKAYNLIDPSIASTLILEEPSAYIPIQVSKEKPFLEEHIPHAQNIWRPDYGSDNSLPYGGLIPTPNKLENLLQELGYEEGKTLLLYDIKANVDAMRFAWVLNLYGFDNFKIINGGLKYWKMQGLPITNEKTVDADTSKYKLANNFDDSMIAHFDDVLAAIQDTNTILIDTREEYEYLGQPYIKQDRVLAFKKGAFSRGSIPTAIHLNWSTLADLNGDHRIKSEKDLRYDLNKKGISPNKNLILYCQSGSRTSHTYYVLKHILDYPNVKNYDGSWIEWSYKHSIDSTVPIQELTSQKEFNSIKDSLILQLKAI